MNRSLRARVARLEETHRVEPVTLHFTDGNKTPMTISGTAKNFFRIVKALEDYNNPPQLLRGALLQLDCLRRAARIEGRSAQLFALLQALAKGPAPDGPQHYAGVSRAVGAGGLNSLGGFAGGLRPQPPDVRKATWK